MYGCNDFCRKILSIMAPLVSLSTTLASLYSLDGGDSQDIALVYALPHPTRLAASMPVSVRYGMFLSHMCTPWLPAHAEVLEHFHTDT